MFRFSIYFALLVFVVGATIAAASAAHHHPHTSINGLMLVLWGALVLIMLLIKKYEFFFRLGIWITAIGVLLCIFGAAIFEHRHLTIDGLITFFGGIALMGVTYYNEPCKPVHVRTH